MDQEIECHFSIHKAIGTIQIVQALIIMMQSLPIVGLELGVDQRTTPFGISM